MKAHATAVRIAPKKANLIAKMVRGMPVPDAVEALRRTHKKGARIVEQLLRSAMANASHNEKQDPQMMIVKTIVVNQGTAYRRGMPKARGQMRPYRKFLSHISVTLGFPEGESQEMQGKQENQGKGASKTAKNEVQKTRSQRAKAAKKHSPASPDSPDSPAS